MRTAGLTLLLPYYLDEIAKMPSRVRDFPGTVVLDTCPPALTGEGIRTHHHIFLRHLLHALGLDEHALFRWRLDNKYVQTSVLGHYFAEDLPKTGLLASFLDSSSTPSETIDALYRFAPQGFILKRCLGECSREEGLLWRSDEPDELILKLWHVRQERGDDECNDYLVQELIPIEREFRVHSLGRKVLPTLTFRRFGTDEAAAEGDRTAANSYIEGLLARLPPAITNELFGGWDVALTRDGNFKVLEINIAGYHPVFFRGFQCSGYFLADTWAEFHQALLVRSLEDCFGVAVDMPYVRPTAAIRDYCYSYQSVSLWRGLFDELAAKGPLYPQLFPVAVSTKISGCYRLHGEALRMARFASLRALAG